jgi:hypothetical protein
MSLTGLLKGFQRTLKRPAKDFKAFQRLVFKQNL